MINNSLFKTITQFIEQDNTKDEWMSKKKAMLADKIDVAKFITEFIQNYPDSVSNYRELPGYSNQ